MHKVWIDNGILPMPFMTCFFVCRSNIERLSGTIRGSLKHRGRGPYLASQAACLACPGAPSPACPAAVQGSPEACRALGSTVDRLKRGKTVQVSLLSKVATCASWMLHLPREMQGTESCASHEVLK